ncbi:MAG: hypothetical protein KatS3mg002_0012 [Candidatus Woesearchaeota archaeon]|nr:MAG: hypothetical protein KatS3mg002_0012 [Candidatus Woesearchaeota archaeon]
MNKKAVIGIIVLSFIMLIISVILYIQKTHELRKIDPLELESMSQPDIIK